MADISLLFDVAGGGSLSGESGKIISDQLNAIVNEINNNPLKIKFQADPESLASLKSQLENIASTFEKARAIELPSVDISAISQSVRDISSILHGDLAGTLSGINAQLYNVTSGIFSIREAILSIISALPQSGSAFEKMSKEGSVGIDELLNKLTTLQELVDEINSKNFTVTNVFEYKRSNNASTEEIELYREKATELLSIITSLQDEIKRVSEVSGSAFSNALRLSGEFNNFWSLSERYKGTEIYTGEIAGATTVGSLNKLIGTLSEYQRVYDSILVSAKNNGIDVIFPNTAGFESAIGKIQEYDERTKALEQSFVDAANAAAKITEGQSSPQEGISNATREQTENVRA